jgi:hypothetical protein
MQPYSLLYQIFKAVLNQSATIQGRVYWAPQFGIEINTDQLNQVFSEHSIPKKYPLSLIMPPRSNGKMGVKSNVWESYSITMFFLRTTYYEGTQVARRNLKTGTSERPVTEDWDAMKAASNDFIKVVKLVQDRDRLYQTSFRLSDDPAYSVPVSFVGTDRVSGVRLDFKCSIFVPCELTDYDPDNIPNISI